MTEAANASATEAETGPKTFEEFLALSKFPPEALKPLTDKVAEYTKLVTENNTLVAKVNAAKAKDPSNTEYLDSLWKSLYASDEEMVEVEAQFQAASAEYERLLAKLRNFAKANIPEALSEDAAKEAKKKVNEFNPIISESRKAIAAMATMAETMIGIHGGKLPEGGLVTLLPNPDSLKNPRGRAAATASGNTGSNMTRVGEVLLDDVSTNIDGRGKFNYAADKLTEKFNGKAIPENKVTAEELEEAYWNAVGKPIRSMPSTQLDLEVTFTFEKTVKVKNKNDDSFTEVPQKVKVTVRNPNYGKTETETAETPKQENAEAPKVETPKTETAPAKKAAPATQTATTSAKK